MMMMMMRMMVMLVIMSLIHFLFSPVVNVTQCEDDSFQQAHACSREYRTCQEGRWNEAICAVGTFDMDAKICVLSSTKCPEKARERRSLRLKRQTQTAPKTETAQYQEPTMFSRVSSGGSKATMSDLYVNSFSLFLKQKQIHNNNIKVQIRRPVAI
ncbi:hypothetical protein ElyMa_000381000 [Elysia marginata]|uniref:Chitin-binding type-2 domain-containing protein n=1 Tax=Elysia marginata TaxID=1093978 RepID=A0AAV4FI06_9GAST|nr:hypothetical protein ElyMa_000381000 [Elysia marginata]